MSLTNVDSVKSKMATLKELELQNQKMKGVKQEIDTELQPVRNFLKDKFMELRAKDPKIRNFEWGGMRVELVPKKSQTKPTIQMGYTAVKNVLGDQALMLVKDRVEALKKYRKEHATKQKSVVMVKMGELRKVSTKTIQKRLQKAEASKLVSTKVDLKPAKAVKKVTEKKPKYIKRKAIKETSNIDPNTVRPPKDQ